MRIRELVEARHIVLGLEADDVHTCLTRMIDRLQASGACTAETAARLEAALLAREQLGSTGIGSGVALPHAYVEGLAATTMAIATLAAPVDFMVRDGLPVDLVLLVAGPPGEERRHLTLIARIARLLHDADFLAGLRAATTPEEALSAIEDVESRHP
jgi:PTS system nitrogen regulatory IIA component